MSNKNNFQLQPNEEKLTKLKALLNKSNGQTTNNIENNSDKQLSSDEKLAKLKELLSKTNQTENEQVVKQSDHNNPLTNEEKLAKLKDLLAKNQQESSTSQSIPQQNTNNLPPFVQQVIGKNYHIFIGTPCYGGMCHVNYVVRLMNTQQLLAQLGIQCTVEFMKNESLITRARNNMVAKFMHNPEITHLMFIDADITWHPMDIVKLLAADKDVVGGIYPKKRYTWERLTPENIKDFTSRKKLFYNKDKSDEDLIRENLVNYNLNYDRKTMKIENNLLEIYTLATGFMMIKRNVFPILMKKYPEKKYTDDVGYLQSTENDYAYNLFDTEIVDGHLFSEDWWFCHIWRLTGGKIYCDVSIELSHSGQEDYKGRLLSSLVIQ
jgi:hypothetical protein